MEKLFTGIKKPVELFLITHEKHSDMDE